MAYPASEDPLARVLVEADNTALAVQNFASNQRAAMAAAPIGGRSVMGILDNLVNYRDKLNGYAATPGIIQYARDQKNDQGLDVVVEWNAMISAIQDAIDEITATYPIATHITGYDGNDDPVYQTIASAQTANLQADLLVVVNSVS